MKQFFLAEVKYEWHATASKSSEKQSPELSRELLRPDAVVNDRGRTLQTKVTSSMHC